MNFDCVKLYFLLMLLPVCASAKGPYQIHRLSEPAIQHTYIRLLENACRYADRDWETSSFNLEAGYWGDGVSGGNGGIRTIGSMVLGCGTLLRYDDGLNRTERRNLLDKTIAALRYATATHFTGTQKCTDGKQWGGLDRPGSKAWQSSYWTSSLAFGAWLIWDQLNPALRYNVERVVAAQDDLLAQGNPPTEFRLDTKAEENGWDVPCLVLGELMFPSNPHAALWHKTALKYMMNTLSTPADLQDSSMVDGRPVNQWVLGPNLYPGFALENHGFFHPSYIACSSYFLTQAAMYYAYAGRPIPLAATHHLMDVWRMFKTIILPWGETAYPQGMDWELHGVPFINLYATLATHSKDPYAARMEQTTLQYMRDWQIMCQGSLTVPGSRFGIVRHAITLEQAAYGFLAHKIFGPSIKELTARAAAVQEESVWEYADVGFIAHRTLKKFASFSWQNRIMGLLIPIEDHEDNPDFAVPMTDGYVGSFKLYPGGRLKTTVVEHSWRRTPDGFETAGTLLLDGGRLKQALKMVSIGSQTVVYADRVTALSNVIVHAELGVPSGIENDKITGGARVVSDQDGQTIFNFEHPQPPLAIPGSWANVDGRLGVVMAAGSGMTYVQARRYSQGISVYTDVLYGSYSNQPRQFKAGQNVATRIAVLFVEVTPTETAKLAQSFRIEAKRGGRVLHFKQPNGKVVEVPLL